MNKENNPLPNKKKRGLGSASAETRLRVSSIGGNAIHEKRGLQASDQETRQRVSSLGGKASYKNKDVKK